MPEARGWGGKREGAGRKKQPGSGLPHRARPLLASRFPVHVTMKVVSDLPNLRAKPQLRVIEAAFRAALGHHGLNLAHYSIQRNHLHLITEAKDRDVLMKGLRGLAIRLARRLNDRLGRHGRVFADRYHQRILKTPSETKHAVAYVLKNASHCTSSLFGRNRKGQLLGRMHDSVLVARTRLFQDALAHLRTEQFVSPENPRAPG